MKIEIIGSNTINGIKLKKRILNVVNLIDEKVVISLVEDYDQKNLPFLYINGRLISKGRIISEKEIVKYLQNGFNE